MKRDLFSWEVLSSLLTACQSLSVDGELPVFVLSLFTRGPCCLYDPLPVFSFASHVPTMIFRVLSTLNPFRFAFDRSLYLAILRVHPEVLFLLFSNPNAANSSDSGSAIVDRSQSRALIHWILEPRESAVWYNTVDFLIQVLRLPLPLPSDAFTASQNESTEVFFEQIHRWLFPDSLSRNVHTGKRSDW